MGLLGTITLGGYRAMQRGIEERGVMENVNHFIRSAYRRAQIDRQPVALFFWNVTIREETDDEPIVVSGRAVAVHRTGRVSRYVAPYLYDEFSDLERERLVTGSEDWDEGNAASGAVDSDNLVPLYKLNSKNSCGRSLVSQTTVNVTEQNRDLLLSEMATRPIPCWAYVLAELGTVDSWNVGDAYGVEFADLELPKGYLFDSNYKRTPRDRLTSSDYKVLWFDVGSNSGGGATGGINGESTVRVYSLRPDRSGAFKPQLVSVSANPSERLQR